MAQTQSNLKRLAPFIWPQRAVLTLALLCTLGFVASMPALAYLAERLAKFIGAGDLFSMTELSYITVAVFIVRGLFQYGQDTLMAKASLQAVTDLRDHVFAHVQSLDIAFFMKTRAGDLAYLLTADVDRLSEAVRRFFGQFIPSILTIIFVVAYLIYLNWALTLLTLTVAPLLGLTLGVFGQKLRDRSRESQDLSSDLSALLTELFGGIRVIQGFATEGYEAGRFRAKSEANRAARFKSEQIKAVQFPVGGFLQAVGVLMLVWVGGWQISMGKLDASQFIGFMAGIGLLIDPIVLITTNFNELKQAESSADRLFELLAIKPKVKDLPDAKPLPPVRGVVQLNHVSFSYAETPVLVDINIVGEPGQVLALVGPSGGGKSSLVNLLSRFWDPQEGQILVDGVDIRTVTLPSLRRQIGLVPQETVLFSGTIAENIAYGRKNTPLADIEQAARIANAHEFILALPQGYQTRVGERGANLSGGQRQRVAIARAVLLDPKILLLDEATSALDVESEALVQEALNRLMKGRTVFIIAHRLSTIRDADRIFVIDQGRVVEQGNHSTLLKTNGLYAQLYARQLEPVVVTD
ncbi:ABC transporter ATP-binding protein [Candidatus Cyanaurora vandensis]|uniref:ABC transporter ATP-binding protein n=1 Tax=Candidatus Cyanaurora vandensis TaxID=2714958 RepID=UPI0025809758|nr:ABC transporter ATP-binding protein [Candidatus Cyanaurora vandensis]